MSTTHLACLFAVEFLKDSLATTIKQQNVDRLIRSAESNVIKESNLISQEIHNSSFIRNARIDVAHRVGHPLSQSLMNSSVNFAS